MSRLAPALLTVSLALTLGGCGPKVVRRPVFEGDGVRVELRRTLDGGEPVPRGHAHPAVIADVRLARILAQLSRAGGAGGGARPIVRAEHVDPLAEGLRAAFAAAEPDDEAVATAVATERRLGIFTHDRVTAFRAFFDRDFLVFEFYAVDEELAGAERRRGRDYQVPLELPDARLGLVAGEAQEVRGPRGVRVDWRDPHFRKPVQLDARGSASRRKTVLMESEGAPLEPLPELDLEGIPLEQRDAQLRALDQLDAARRTGRVTEAEFRRRRRLVLEGRLEEAGYPGPSQ